MRISSGLLLGACFVLGMALVALFIVLLRSFLLHLAKLQAGRPISEVEPYAGVGQKERIRRPAFLYSIQD
jgi:hypothetical protein